jgi:hypothetical protein
MDTKNNMTLKEFFGWQTPVNEVFPNECSCSCNAPVFEGTTRDLLEATQAAMSPSEVTEEQIMQEAQVTEEQFPTQRDLVWLNVDLLKMALEIETSRTQKMAFYIDVGNLPKAKAEQYIKENMAKFTDTTGECKPGHFWLPRREGGRGTEVTVVPGRVTLEAVLETATKLRDFVTAK